MQENAFYSGVQLDFAYQRKPLVYSHFDDIYSSPGLHSYEESYFDYETQGFGPITATNSAGQHPLDSLKSVLKWHRMPK